MPISYLFVWPSYHSVANGYKYKLGYVTGSSTAFKVQKDGGSLPSANWRTEYQYYA